MHPDVLLPYGELASLIEEARRCLADVPNIESRYGRLVEFARIHQKLGNRLAVLIYDRARENRRPKFACAAGCSTCCYIPSSARPDSANSFVLTLLDVITLIENYPAIKIRDAVLLERAQNGVEHARTSNEVAVCPHLNSEGRCSIYAVRPVA